jgi:hypothetical protein
MARKVKKTKRMVRVTNDDLAGEPRLVEPVVDAGDSRLAKALSWYAYLQVSKKSQVMRTWIHDYAVVHMGLDVAEKVSRLPDSWVSSAAGGLSRIILNGAQVPEEVIRRHEERIIDALRQAQVS